MADLDKTLRENVTTWCKEFEEGNTLTTGSGHKAIQIWTEDGYRVLVFVVDAEGMPAAREIEDWRDLARLSLDLDGSYTTQLVTVLDDPGGL